MFHAAGIDKSFGSLDVLDKAAITIGRGERVGLVGRNGCGKSTLLKILAGVDSADGKAVREIANGHSIGYLPQFPDFDSDAVAFEAVAGQTRSVMEPWQLRRALWELGLSDRMLDSPARSLSGGEKTGILLACLLAGNHDLLLLDEPTSHLDITMLERLESVLCSYRGAVLAASHDRRFLDKVVTRIVELDHGRMQAYTGGFSDYAREKQLTLEKQKEDYILQQRQIRALREFALRKLQWASKAESGPKRGRDQRGHVAVKLARHARAAENRIARMEEAENARDAASLHGSFRPTRRSGQTVLEARGLSQGFGGRTLFHVVDLTVRYGERIGIIGPNGSGKSSLLRVLLGADCPSEGAVRRGSSVDVYYVGQEQEQLDPAATVLDALISAGQLSGTEARTLLACFLFREAEVFKRVSMLSGGERVRLAAACAVVSGANLLVLDEPTNHLDIDTRERLEEALAEFEGTLMVVSHDRYLLDRLTERTLALANGVLKDYPGTYSELIGRGEPS